MSKESVQETAEADASLSGLESPPNQRRLVSSRIITGVLGGCLALFALFTTHAFLVFVLALIVGIIGFNELVKIAGLEDRPLAGVAIGLLCYVAPVVVAWATKPGSPPFWITIWIAYLAGCVGVLQGLRRGYSAPLSAGWLGAPLATVLITHQQTPIGTGYFAPNMALMLLVPLWVGDTVAMFVGRAFGRRKLAPAISPSKTWEGAAGNLIACVATSLILGSTLHLNPVASLLVGTLTGVLGQLGDLAQSALKRVTGLKDSGGALPGHGGILDRLDSFLLSAVPCATVIWLSDTQLFHVKLWP